MHGQASTAYWPQGPAAIGYEQQLAPATSWTQAAQQFAWAPPSQPFYEQQAVGVWPHVVDKGFGQSGIAPQLDLVGLFQQQLGILPEEDVHFGWIAEYGLQEDVMPPPWSIHTDETSGLLYYSDNVTGETSWENPLTPCLREIVDIGRAYFHCAQDDYIEEQKNSLWDRHKIELDSWHGPMTDAEGYHFFINSSNGVSSRQDPRLQTQHFWEIEVQVLDALQDTLAALEPRELPCFGGPMVTETGAEVLSLESQHANAGMNAFYMGPDYLTSPTSPVTPRRAWIQQQLDVSITSEVQKSIFNSFLESDDYINAVRKEEEEAQFLKILRSLKARLMRIRRREEAENQTRLEALHGAMKLEELRRLEEVGRKKALADAEREREEKQAEEARQKLLVDMEARETEEKTIEEARQKQIAAEAVVSKLAETKAEELRQKQQSEANLSTRMQEVVSSHDVAAMRSAIAEGEQAGHHQEVELVRHALDEELQARKKAHLKARKAYEDLAAQFKDAKEAHELGGSILVAQWKAAIREIAKPVLED